MASPKASPKNASSSLEELLTTKDKHIKLSIVCETEDRKSYDFEVTLPSDELIALVQKAMKQKSRADRKAGGERERRLSNSDQKALEKPDRRADRDRRRQGSGNFSSFDIDTSASFPFAIPLPMLVAADSKRLGIKLAVPHFVHEAIAGCLLRHAVSLNSLLDEPSLEKMAELRKLLNSRTAINFDTVSPADAANLVVAFLQELPEALVPPGLQSEILALADRQQSDMVGALKNALLPLPVSNKDLLAEITWCISMLSTSIAQQSGFNSLERLAAFFAPHVFRGTLEGDKRARDVLIAFAINHKEVFNPISNAPCIDGGDLPLVQKFNTNSNHSITAVCIYYFLGGRRMWVADSVGVIRVFDLLKNNALVLEWKTDKGRVTALTDAIGFGGATYMWVTAERGFFVYDAKSMQVIREETRPEVNHSCIVQVDKNLMWIAESSRLRVFSLKGDAMAEHELSPETTMANSNDSANAGYRGGMLFSSGFLWIGGIGKIIVWDCRRQNIAKQILLSSATAKVSAMAQVVQQRVASAGSDGQLLIWDPASFDLVQTVAHPPSCGVTQCVFLNSTGLHLTSATDGRIRVWDSQFELLRTVNVYHTNIHSMLSLWEETAVSWFIYTAGTDRCISLLRVRSAYVDPTATTATATTRSLETSQTNATATLSSSPSQPPIANSSSSPSLFNSTSNTAPNGSPQKRGSPLTGHRDPSLPTAPLSLSGGSLQLASVPKRTSNSGTVYNTGVPTLVNTGVHAHSPLSSASTEGSQQSPKKLVTQNSSPRDLFGSQKEVQPLPRTDSSSSSHSSQSDPHAGMGWADFLRASSTHNSPSLTTPSLSGANSAEIAMSSPSRGMANRPTGGTLRGATASPVPNPSPAAPQPKYVPSTPPLADPKAWVSKPRVAGVWRSSPGQLPTIIGLQNTGLLDAHASFLLELGSLDSSMTRDFEVIDDELRTTPFFTRDLANAADFFFAFQQDGSPMILSVSNRRDSDWVRCMTHSTEGQERLALQMRKEREKDLVKLLNTLKPQYANLKFRRLQSPELSKKIVQFEELLLNRATKVGVLYCGANQTNEDLLYANEQGSADFDSFLTWLGEKVPLKGWTKFKGGLTEQYASHLIYTTYKNVEVAFQVATSAFMSFDDRDPTQPERRRHLTNNSVLLVFRDEGASPLLRLHPESLARNSPMHTVIMVQPERSGDTLYYKIAVACKQGIECFPPGLPFPGKFAKSDVLRNWILAKLVNADRASMFAAEYLIRVSVTRSKMLNSFIESGDPAN